AVASAVLLASAVPVALAYTGIRRGYQGWLRVGLLAGIVLALVYLGLMAFYFDGLDFNWAANAYASLFWGIVWFHGVHVVAALLVAAGVLYHAFRGYFHAERADGVMMATYFWVFVVVAWVPSFLTVFVAPHLLQME